MSETFRPSDNHWTTPHFTECVTEEELEDLLLNRADPIVNGKVKAWKHRKVGPGIYEIWIGDGSTGRGTRDE